jgi:hypothetical protein
MERKSAANIEEQQQGKFCWVGGMVWGGWSGVGCGVSGKVRHVLGENRELRLSPCVKRGLREVWGRVRYIGVCGA